MSKQSLTRASQMYVGEGFFGPMQASNGRQGVPVNLLTKVSLGSPIATNAAGVVSAATSTELPNATTITYTTANSGTSPIDDAGVRSIVTLQTSTGASASVWSLDVARNLNMAVTHATSIVAMSATITGYDIWGQKMVETLSVTATGTSKTATGKKAFKYIESIAFTSAGNATANTASVGWVDVLGLPYKLAAVADCIRVYFNDVLDDAAVVVKADTTTATATTGDVYGTVDTNSAADGSAVVVWMYVADNSTENGLRGVNQYAG